MNLGLYAKSVNNTLIAFFGTLVIVFADHSLSTEDYLTLAVNTLTAAVLITVVKNTERFRVAKLVVSLLVTLVGSLLASYQAGLGLGTSALLVGVLTVLNGFSTYHTPEASQSANIVPVDSDPVFAE